MSTQLTAKSLIEHLRANVPHWADYLPDDLRENIIAGEPISDEDEERLREAIVDALTENEIARRLDSGEIEFVGVKDGKRFFRKVEVQS